VTAVATIYLGWHYVIDDVAGVVIGLIALVLASALTGFKLRTARPPPSGDTVTSSGSGTG